MTPKNETLVQILTALNQIGARVNRLGMGHHLPATLQLIADSAVAAVSVAADPSAPAPNASAVIWAYDEGRQAFDLASRVSAGEPPGASTEDFPRPDGLGMLAIRRWRRILSYEERGLTIHPAKRAVGARSLACCPLIVGDELVGMLYVYRCDDRHFTEIELLLLDNFVNLAALAIYHGRQVGGMTQALARKVSEQEKMSHALRLVSSRINLDETLQEILAIGLDLTGAQYGSFELHDKKQRQLVIRALAGRSGQWLAGPPLPLDEHSIVGWVACQRQSLRVADLNDPPWQSIYQPLPVDRPMRAELAVPLLGAGGGLEGVLNLESPLPDAFTAEDQRLLEALAAQAVIALQEIHLLDALQEIASALLTTPPNALLQLIVDRACDLINVSAGAIWTTAEPEWLTLRQAINDDHPGERLPLQPGQAEPMARLRQPITLDDVRLPSVFPYQNLAVERGWVSAIVAPLLIPDRPPRLVGTITLYAAELRDFGDWDRKLLTCLTNHAAVAIRGAEQLAQLKLAQERQAMAETFAAVGDVAANLMHQLNNKVGAIPPLVQGIEDKCEDVLAGSPYLAAQLNEVEQSARKAIDIVRSSMAHLRPLERRPIEVKRCLEQAVQRAAPPPGVKISYSGLTGLPRAIAGEQQLEMVFYNLIDNALTALAGQGEIRLTGAHRGGQVALTIADTGPGIPPELRPHLFDFSPAKAAAAGEPARRLGFGLWWVKIFVDRFGGRLEVESAPGQGSAFTVYLPAEAPA